MKIKTRLLHLVVIRWRNSIWWRMQGFCIVEAFNEINVDIAKFGQHDFDFGSEVAKKLVEQSAFQWISSNLIDVQGIPFANVPRFKITMNRALKLESLV